MGVYNSIDLMKAEASLILGYIEYGFEQTKQHQPTFTVSFFKNKYLDGGVSFQCNGYTLIAQYHLPSDQNPDASLSLALYNQLINESGFIIGKDGLPNMINARQHRLDYGYYELFLDADNKPVWLDPHQLDLEWKTVDLAGVWISKIISR